MGSSCGKGDQGDYSDNKSDFASENKFLNDPCVADQFSISLHSFSTTTNRLFTKRSSLTRGCKSVVVTQIKLEQNDPLPRKFAKTNSLLHLPVIRLSEMDVRLQLPELLPLNLFSGTQTIFSFIYPDTPEGSHVTLTGKIGTKPISMQKQINKNQILTTEEITQLGKTLDIEMDRYKKNNRKERQDARFHRNGEETPEASSNAETTYSGVGYADESTDSEKEKSKKLAREKRSKMRRKDTPSHHTVPLSKRRLSRGSYRLKQSKQFLEGDKLQEEAEYLASDGGDCTNSASIEMGSGDVSKESRSDMELNSKPKRPVLPNIDIRLTHKLEENIADLPIRVSRSFSNMKELTEDETKGAKFSPISLKYEFTPPITKRKKQSLGTRLAKTSFQGVKPPTVQQLPEIKKVKDPKDLDLDNDADDECECVTDDVRKRREKLIKGDTKVIPTTVFNESQLGTDLRSPISSVKGKETMKEKKDSTEIIGAAKDNAVEKNMSNTLDMLKTVPVQSIKVLTALSPTLKSSELFKEGRLRLKSQSESEATSKITSDNTVQKEATKSAAFESHTGQPKGYFEGKEQIKNDDTVPGSKSQLDHIEKVANKDHDRKVDRSMTISMLENPRKYISGRQRKILSLDEQTQPPVLSQRSARSPVEAFIDSKETKENVGDK